jgi:hypothetical protein
VGRFRALRVSQGQRSVGSELAWAFRFERNGSTTMQYVVKTVDSVRVVPDPADELASKIGAYDLIRFPLDPGRRFRQLQKTIGIDLNADGRADQVTAHSEVSVIAVEDVTTPAGRFDAAVRVRTVVDLETRITGSSLVGRATITTDDWYAPGVGLVRSLSVTVSGGQELERILDEVAAYGVGDRRSDSEPPRLVSVLPADGGLRGSDAMVRLAMSEPKDAVSMGAARIVVRGSGGAELPGAMDVTANTLRWIYNGPIPAGAYTATLEGTPTDLAGNALPAPAPWHITIEPLRLPLQSVTPAPGAMDVPLDQVITIDFDEFPDPGTIAGYVSLTDQQGEVSVALSGRTVTITPQRLLEPGRHHTLGVSPFATDPYGNPLFTGGYGVKLTFIAANGALAYPRRLPLPSEPQSVATGDVDGDGRLELLAMVPSALDAPLHIVRVHADGSASVLGQVPATIQLPAGDCIAGDFAFGDVSGDGLGDIVLAGTCGLRVLSRQADGSYLPWSDVASPGLGRIRLADMDGDGRLDAVTLREDAFQPDNEFRIWRWPGGPVAVASDPIIMGTDGIMDFRLGDTNADGRPDIVAAVVEHFRYAVAWRLQAPDDRYGEYQSRTYGASARSESLALGDVNQDGLNDVIVSQSANRPTQLFWLPQLADGSLGAAQSVQTYDLPGPAVVTDLDLDGRNDILVAHGSFSRLGVYRSAAGGPVDPELLHTVTSSGYGPDYLAVGDLNGDGRPDVVLGRDLLLQRDATAQPLEQAAKARASSYVGGALWQRQLRIGFGASARACTAR